MHTYTHTHSRTSPSVPLFTTLKHQSTHPLLPFSLPPQVGSAMAKAVAAGNDGAVVEATATVFCSGTTAQAQAWSEAVAQSVRINPVTGCVIIQRVVARAQAMCANGVATATAQSFVTRRVLPGTCNIFGWTTSGSFPAQQQGGARAFASAQASASSGSPSWVAAADQQFA